MTPDSATDNRRIVADAYDALDRGDVAGFLATLAEDVVWEDAAGLALTGGKYIGIPDVVEKVLGPFTASILDLNLKPTLLLSEGSKVVALGRYKGQSLNGESIDVPFTHTWTMSQGSCVRFEQLTDTAVLNRHLPAG